MMTMTMTTITVEEAILSDYKVGEVVISYTKYKTEFMEDGAPHWWYIWVKCKIVKINKKSLTLQHYDCIIDESDVYRALSEQTYGVRKFKWFDDRMINKKTVCKNVEKLIRKGDSLYDDYVKSYSYTVDFGN